MDRERDGRVQSFLALASTRFLGEQETSSVASSGSTSRPRGRPRARPGPSTPRSRRGHRHADAQPGAREEPVVGIAHPARAHPELPSLGNGQGVGHSGMRLTDQCRRHLCPLGCGLHTCIHTWQSYRSCSTGDMAAWTS